MAGNVSASPPAPNTPVAWAARPATSLTDWLDKGDGVYARDGPNSRRLSRAVTNLAAASRRVVLPAKLCPPRIGLTVGRTEGNGHQAGWIPSRSERPKEDGASAVFDLPGYTRPFRNVA
jgi:hypothetical protein